MLTRLFVVPISSSFRNIWNIWAILSVNWALSYLYPPFAIIYIFFFYIFLTFYISIHKSYFLISINLLDTTECQCKKKKWGCLGGRQSTKATVVNMAFSLKGSVNLLSSFSYFWTYKKKKNNFPMKSEKISGICQGSIFLNINPIHPRSKLSTLKSYLQYSKY